MLLALALAGLTGAADLTPTEVDALLTERRQLTEDRPRLEPAISLVAVGAAGWVAAIADVLVLGYFELNWAFNGFGRQQSVVDGMLIFAAVAAAAGLAIGVPSALWLVHRVIDRGRGTSRVDEIDHELRLRSDVDPTRL